MPKYSIPICFVLLSFVAISLDVNSYTYQTTKSFIPDTLVKGGFVSSDDAAYDSAYIYLSQMLDKQIKYNFKKAVFVSENAFLGNKIIFDDFDFQIQWLVTLCKGYLLNNKNNLKYNYADKDEVLKYAAVFKVITDSIEIKVDTTTDYHLPFQYDFQDFSGIEDWKNMFVMKLLWKKKGNCHSLPFLYKILVEELGGTAHLALAPNHIYIKHWSEKLGMYNTELTSATFPVDAWLMASGYIHLSAIQNGVYMDKLNDEQSIALCLFDLAKGYERKYGHRNDLFIKQCIDKVLQHYPIFINALLFKSELMKREIGQANDQDAKLLFQEYEKLIAHIFQLGYRKMPDEMYMNWLVDLKENEEKYLNKKVMDNFNLKN